MGTQLLAGMYYAHRKKFIYEKIRERDNFLIICADGSFEVKSGKDTWHIGKNEGFAFRENIIYNRKIIEPANIFVFRYKSDTTVFKNPHVKFTDTDRLKSTLSMLEKLETENYSDSFTYQKHLFLDIVNQYTMENDKSGLQNQKDDSLMNLAIALMKSSFVTGKSLSEIGEATGLSYVHFIRRFKNFTGVSPGEYMKRLRIGRAKDLLSGTNLLIKDIAQLCGFESEYYFSNYFRKNAGLSPTDFRNTSK